MKVEVIVHEAGDEEVAMVIAGLNAEFQRKTSRLGGGRKLFRCELFRQKIVSVTLIDQHGELMRALAHEVTAVVLEPKRLIRSQIVTEGFFSPGTLTGSNDG